MDLVSLAKKNYLNFEKILIDKFIDLGIKKEEMLFLLKLNDCFLKEQTIVDLKKLDQENKFKDKAENIFMRLLKRDLIEVFPDKPDFSLLPLYEKLFKLLENGSTENSSLGYEVAEKIKAYLNRGLTGTEYEQLALMVETKPVSLKLVDSVIDLARKQNNRTFAYILTLLKSQLNKRDSEVVDIDGMIDEALGGSKN